MPTWFTRRVFDLVRALTNAYYGRKYGAMSRRLGRPGIAPSHRRGFIIIQVDGLSHEHLLEALEAGYVPYLSRLLDEGGLSLGHWRCGLPSTTPAVQAGIMFGNRFDIPGFRWYEKETRRSISAKRPDQLQRVRQWIGRGRPGILRGGSCYVSMFDGDADLALFTISAMTSQRFFESVRGVGLFLLFLLSPFRVLRLLGLSLGNYLFRLVSRLPALARPSVVNPLDPFSPLFQAISDALLTETQTFGVMLDIYRCAPAIYANYNGYDEAAHQMGPASKAAFRALRGVDKRLRQINRMRTHYRWQVYDLYLLSDHGNAPATPFDWLNGCSLGQHIARHVGRNISVAELAGAHVHPADKARFLLMEWEVLEERVSPRLRKMLSIVRRYMDQQMMSARELDCDLERRQDVVISVSGPLAHVYFNVSAQALDLVEVILLYPRLVDQLLETPGVGALFGRAGEQTLVLGKGGGTIIGDDVREVVKAPHPLPRFGDVDYVRAQLHQLAHFPHAGDLILLGDVEPDGRVVGFESQVSTHGGLGGAQDRPFIAWPPGNPLKPEALKDAQDLYVYFYHRYVEPPGNLAHFPVDTFTSPRD